VRQCILILTHHFDSSFLSCLYGSAPGQAVSRKARVSKLPVRQSTRSRLALFSLFLSCLYGRDTQIATPLSFSKLPVRQSTQCGLVRFCRAFLSCLYGRAPISDYAVSAAFSKLPVRQSTPGTTVAAPVLFSKLPVRQSTARTRNFFLSCLYGREQHHFTQGGFLSCLYGRAPSSIRNVFLF
jgi:hypothetical protein